MLLGEGGNFNTFVYYVCVKKKKKEGYRKIIILVWYVYVLSVLQIFVIKCIWVRYTAIHCSLRLHTVNTFKSKSVTTDCVILVTRLNPKCLHNVYSAPYL
jgi:uncharacterized membrane protein